MNKELLGKTALPIILSAVLFLFFNIPAFCGPIVPLDREAVFCLYFKKSGEPIEFIDIEEYFSFEGKPLFSNYKPSEMFMKNSLRELRNNFLDTAHSFEKTTLFRWKGEGIYISKGSDKKKGKITIKDKTTPKPTIFISSEISEKNWREVERGIKYLAGEILKLENRTCLNISVDFLPDKIEKRRQRRNIALEDVSLPIRVIKFRPVRVGVSIKNPGGDLSHFSYYL